MRNSMARQQGITLIEVSIALIVAAVVAAAAFLLFSQNLKRQDARDTTALMTNIVSDLRAKFGKQGGYTGITAVGAQGAGVLSTSVFNTASATGATPKNTNFFGSINVAQNGTTATSGDITVTLRTDNANCTEIATAMLSGGAPTVTVGSTANISTAGAAAAACGGLGTTTAGTVSATLVSES